MIGQFYINELDAFLEWGLTFEKGAYEKLTGEPTKKKQGLTKIWQNQDGTERDTSLVYLESITYQFNVMLTGINENDYWQKFFSLKDLHKGSGYILFRCAHLNLQYYLYFESIGKVEYLKGLSSNGKVKSKFSLTFINDHLSVAPAPPNVQADDTADTLKFTHTAGNAVIQVNINNAGWLTQPDNGYNVGNVTRASGYYKARAFKDGLYSTVVNSPAFNVVSGSIIITNALPAALPFSFT